MPDPIDDPLGEGHPISRPTKVIFWSLLPVALLLPLLSAFLWLMLGWTESGSPDRLWYQLWSAFDIGAEGNVAVWYASTLWFLLGLCAVLAALLAPRHRPSWWLFAAVCVVAAADEAAELHERLIFVGDRLRVYVPFDLFYSWVIPGTIIAVVVAALLARLVLALRKPVTWTLVLAGAVFLLGALVIETATGFVHLNAGEFTPLYATLMYVEETLELVGVSLAIVALASMFEIRRATEALTVTFDGYRTPPLPATDSA